MTHRRLLCLCLVVATAGCSRTMCDIPDITSGGVKVSFHIQNFGPRTAKAGEPFNVQPDGTSAAWFKLDSDVDGSEIRVHFGDAIIPGTISGDVVTIKVPENAHAKPGEVRVTLEKLDGSFVSKSNTVTIDLEKP